jgi:hypothetical protein
MFEPENIQVLALPMHSNQQTIKKIKKALVLFLSLFSQLVTLHSLEHRWTTTLFTYDSS